MEILLQLACVKLAVNVPKGAGPHNTNRRGGGCGDVHTKMAGLRDERLGGKPQYLGREKSSD